MNIKFILKRWYVILLTALLGSGILYVEKKHVSPPISKTGTMIYSRYVKFDNLSQPIKLDNNKDDIIIREVALEPLVTTWGSYQRFIEVIGEKYEFTKFEPKWNNLEPSKKYTWVGKHFYIKRLGNDIYEIVMKFEESDAKMASYIKENNDAILNDYIAFLKKEASILNPNITSVQEISSFSSVDTDMDVNPGTLPKKYAIIGFVLGGLASTAVLCVLSMRKF